MPCKFMSAAIFSIALQLFACLALEVGEQSPIPVARPRLESLPGPTVDPVNLPVLSIKPQEPSKDLRIHLVSGSRQSSYTFVRAKFLPGEVEDPWAVRFLDDQSREVPHFVWDSLTWQEAREGLPHWG